MSCGTSQPARAMVAAAPTATALPPVSPYTSVATIVPVSIAAAPPWKKIPAAANFPNRRATSSVAGIRCSLRTHLHVGERNALQPKGEGSDAGDAQQVRCLDNQRHGQGFFLGHSQKTQREDRADDETPSDAREVTDNHEEPQEHHQEQVFGRLKSDP